MENTTLSDSYGTLYEQDFVAWADQMASLLEQHRFSELDLDNLVEEVRDLGNRHRDAIESQLTKLMTHLLKWNYQLDRRGVSWQGSIKEAKKQIYRLMRKHPILKTHLVMCFDECYQDAREDAADETSLDVDRFPRLCPFSLEDCLNQDFLPN